MAVENVSEVVSNLPPELVQNINSLTNILTALGGIIFIYFVWSVISVIMEHRRNKRLDEILGEMKKLNRNISRTKIKN